MSPKSELCYSISPRSYPLQAIHAACYRFIDRAYLRLSRSPAGDILVSVRPKTGADLASMDDDFREELSHQALRLKIAQSNQEIREHVVLGALQTAP